MTKPQPFYTTLLAEGNRRRGGQAFEPEDLCFPEQLAFVASREKRRVARCSRRGGKTTGVGIMLLRGAIEPPYANQGYVTLSLKNAKRLVWPTLKKLNAHYNLGGIPNESEGYLRFPTYPNQPHIYLGGAKDKEEVEKLRGWEGGVKRWVVDESQSLRQTLMRGLIDDVIEPSLFDYDGELVVLGTPSPLRAGYFWDIDQGVHASGWKHFSWTLRNNPFLQAKSGKSADQLLAELRERRKWDESNPTYRREYLGEWVDDPGALMLHYEAGRNLCGWQSERAAGWTYVLCGDVGYDDADALAVLGWQHGSQVVHLVAEFVRPGQNITKLGDAAKLLYDQWRPIRMPFDFGGLGKKIGMELQSRWGLPVEAADKPRKAEHIALLDAALQSGTFAAPPDSRFAQDCAIMQWDAEAKAKGVMREDPEYHSDIVDAVLYGYRACLAHFEREAPPPPNAQEQLRKERFDRFKAAEAKPWWEGMGETLGYGEE